jgi:hypothetical protein
MGWIYIEAGVALAIAIVIVWWTTRGLRGTHRDDDDKR